MARAAERTPDALLTPEAAQNPYPIYDELRSISPVLWGDAMNAWLVTGYDQAKLVLDDSERFSSQGTRGRDVVRLPPERKEAVPLLYSVATTPALSFSDPPTHTFHRGLVNRPLTPRVISSRQDWLDEYCDTLIGAMAAKPDPDVVQDVALPLSLGVLAELFGAPLDYRELYLTLEAAQTRYYGAFEGSWDAALAAEALFEEFRSHVGDLVREKRERPDDSLLAALVTPAADGRLPGEDEVFAMCCIFLGAAFQNTASAVATGLYGLLSTGQDELVRADPGLAQASFAEALRWEAPAHRLGRRATADVEIDEARIREGDLLWVVVGAANRDPAVFDQPDRFDLAREVKGHLAFGHGVHYCVGAGLGRAENVTVTAKLLERFPRLRLRDGWAPRWDRFPSNRFLASLPLELGPAA